MNDEQHEHERILLGKISKTVNDHFIDHKDYFKQSEIIFTTCTEMAARAAGYLTHFTKSEHRQEALEKINSYFMKLVLLHEEQCKVVEGRNAKEHGVQEEDRGVGGKE